ncbi:hypothetical protein [Actinomyces ruminicola]|uniref:hypothetical protein n=1 Tax=Actinomyces ruminicola TaxID=332524 RepID=UPI00115FCCB7|nr:hypothetical protein [Actinomyces ruminicola]
MSSLNPLRVCASLVIVVAAAGCSGGSTTTTTGPDVEASTEVSAAHSSYEPSEETIEPSVLATTESTDSDWDDSFDEPGDTVENSGVLDPDQTEGRDLTLADFFSKEGQGIDETLYGVASLEEQKGIGAVLAWEDATMELRLANRYTSLAFSAGQANSSKSSDNVLRVEIYKNGKSADFVDIPFNEVYPFNVDVSNVNALKIVLKCRTQNDRECDYDESVTGVLYSMRLGS